MYFLNDVLNRIFMGGGEVRVENLEFGNLEVNILENRMGNLGLGNQVVKRKSHGKS